MVSRDAFDYQAHLIALLRQSEDVRTQEGPGQLRCVMEDNRSRADLLNTALGDEIDWNKLLTRNSHSVLESINNSHNAHYRWHQWEIFEPEPEALKLDSLTSIDETLESFGITANKIRAYLEFGSEYRGRPKAVSLHFDDLKDRFQEQVLRVLLSRGSGRSWESEPDQFMYGIQQLIVSDSGDFLIGSVHVENFWRACSPWNRSSR